MDHSELFSQTEAARLIGVSRQAVANRITARTLEVVEVAGSTMVPGREIARWIAERRRRGEALLKSAK